MLKHRNAIDEYNQMVSQYNSAGRETQIGLAVELARKRAVIQQRVADANELARKIQATLADKTQE